MTLASEVFQLIRAGAEPAEVMFELDISRYRYDAALDGLVAMGALGQSGQLPDSAEPEICPPSIVSKLFLDIFDSTDWSSRITSGVRSMCSRYGIIEPTTEDPRYTFANWTGQAFRRVDFTASDGREYMVVGALMPRADRKRWKQGVPYVRTVYIERDDSQISMIWQRGRFLSSDRVLAMMGYPRDATDLISELTLAIAWVCETRALFPERLTAE